MPKTASTSVSQLLVNEFEGEFHGAHHNVVVPNECTGYYKFCTVRHPYTRAMSLFFHAKRTPKHRCNKVASGTFVEYMEWLVDLNKEPLSFVNSNDIRPSTQSSLEAEFYRESINTRRGRDLNQVDFLSYFIGVNYIEKMDYIIRMENLQDGLSNLPFIGKNFNIPKKNVTDDRLGLQLNPYKKNLIYQWAKDDFFAFNYGR